jgi:CysZ protein
MDWKGNAKELAKTSVALPKQAVVGYWRGLTFPFRGFAFVYFRHFSLARFWIWPILITLVLLGVGLWIGWALHEEAVLMVWDEPTAEGFWGSVARFFHGFVEILVLIVLWALAFLGVVLVTNIIAAPFNDLLSEEVEHIVKGTPGPPLSLKVILRDSVRAILLEIVKLVIYALVMGPTFIIAQFVPVVGQVVYTILGFLFTAIYFSIDYIDWPASRRNRGIRYRFGMMRDHFLPMIGFGSGVWIFLFIPLVNLLFMPACVAGGTLLYLELEGPSEKPAGDAGLEPGTPYVSPPLPNPDPPRAV